MKRYKSKLQEAINKLLSYSIYQKGDLKLFKNHIVDAYNSHYKDANYNHNQVEFSFKSGETKIDSSKPIFVNKFRSTFKITATYLPAEHYKKGSGKIIEADLELETTYRLLNAETELALHANFTNLITGKTEYIQFIFE